MEQNRSRITDQGLGLAAISYDSVAVLKAFADREHIGFELLSDPDSAVIRGYGILNESVEKSSPFFGIPHPGTYVLNERGVVIAKYFEDHNGEYESVKARHVLIRSAGSPVPLDSNKKELTDEQAKAKAEQIRARLVKGEDFATVAKAVTVKPGEFRSWRKAKRRSFIRCVAPR